jgi:amidase
VADTSGPTPGERVDADTSGPVDGERVHAEPVHSERVHAERVHAFTDDVLGSLDAVALGSLVARGTASPAELADAALRRAREVADRLGAVAHHAERPRRRPNPASELDGVPTYLKDNTDVVGMPSNHGTAAFVARLARKDGAFAGQYLATGMTVLGKSRMPEFGFNASTEFEAEGPAHNPWDPAYSVGGSSGGAAALVAAGVVPIAHANDGGGSIRIPAATAGLVGLKPTRGRHRPGEQARSLPIDLVSEGVVTRTVRDTAAFVHGLERGWRNPALPPVGRVTGPSTRRLRIGFLDTSVGGAELDATTAASLEATASVLASLGHHVEPVPVPVGEHFAEDFVLYWGLLSLLASVAGKVVFHRAFDPARMDALSVGLREHTRRQLLRMPLVLRRLARSGRRCGTMFDAHEVVLSPVVAQRTPALGHLSPLVDYETLIERLRAHVAFTPLHNVAVLPAIAVPGDLDAGGLPTSTMLSASWGDERTLLELAFELEEARPFPRIEDRPRPARA